MAIRVRAHGVGIDLGADLAGGLATLDQLGRSRARTDDRPSTTLAWMRGIAQRLGPALDADPARVEPLLDRSATLP